MTKETRLAGEALLHALQRENPMADQAVKAYNRPRRYARSTRSKKVGTHLWPDVLELVQKHAEEHQLTPSGAVHDCLRRYFNLPDIH